MKFFYKGKDVDFISEEKVLNILNIKEQRPNILIAKYKFDKSIYDNLMPEFNAEFTNYEIVDEYLDTEDIVTTTTETMMIMDYDAEPDEYGILTTEYEVENVSTFSAENIVTRSIYSEDLPTMMRFGELSSEYGNTASDRSKSLLNILYLNVDNLNNLNSMFRLCNNVTSISTSNWNTSSLTKMEETFHSCQSLTALDVSNWDVSNVTDMYYMFYNCQSLTSLDVNNWDTGKVTNMGGMFEACQSLTSLDVSNFNTSNVTDMWYMFNNCQSLTSLDVSNFNTSKVTTMRAMFNNCQSLTSLDVSNFDTSKVTNMTDMFRSCKSLTQLDVSNFDTSKVTNMRYIFQECSNLVSIDMNNSDSNSVNKIITELPTRTTDSIGTLDITGIDDISQVNIGAAESKYWNILNEEKLYFILGKSKLGQAKLN